MARIQLILLGTLGLGSLTIGCGKKASDQTLTTDIQAKLYSDAMTKPSNITVAAQHGVVTLSGDVPSSDVELEAMKVANATPGVSHVNDQMKVNPAMAGNQLPEAGSASGQAADAPVAAAPDTTSAPTPPATAPGAPAPVAPGQASAPPPPPTPAALTVPVGERIRVRMIDSINSKTNTAGQVFRATLYGPLTVHGAVAVPGGQPVSVLLDYVKSAGRVVGKSELEVRLSRLEYHGRSYTVDSSIYEEEGKSRGEQTAVHTGVGAAAGAIIGAIAGGGRGAAIGSAAGGGAGLGTQLFTHGKQVSIPSETILTFRLRAPLTLQQ